MTVALSVLVAAHNEQAYIADALQSVFAQDLSNSEIVVVDDGSCDDTAAITEAFRTSAPSSIDVHLLRHETNRGLAHARNTALAKARGVRVVLLDADDGFAPGALATLGARLQNDSSARLVFPRYRWITSEGKPLPVSSPKLKAPISGAIILTDNPIHSDSGVMTHHADLAAIGGFDETLTGYIGADAWVRFAFAHKPAAIVREHDATVLYRRHDAQITRDWRRMDRNWRLLEHKLTRQHGDAFAPIRAKATARHRLYCAHLAYIAGERLIARDLFKDALQADPALLFQRGDARRLMIACGMDMLPMSIHDRVRAWVGKK